MMIKLKFVTNFYWLSEYQKKEKEKLGTENTPLYPHLDKIFLEELKNFPDLKKENIEILVKRDPFSYENGIDMSLVDLIDLKVEEVDKKKNKYRFLIPEERFYCMGGSKDDLYDVKDFRKEVRWALYRMSKGLENKSKIKKFFNEIGAEMYSRRKLKPHY